MRVLRIGRCLSVSVVVVVCLVGAACFGGNGIEGTYHGGAMVLDFKGDKVTVTAMGESQTLDYTVDGDKVTIVNPAEGDLVLTRNADGTLNTAMGTFTKKSD